MSWVKQSISLATLSFIAVVLFIAFSSPFVMLMDVIDNQSSEHIDDADDNESVHTHTTNFRYLFGIIFAFALISYIIAAILISHKEEGEEYYYRDNRGGPYR